jgi:hypothetical protein
MKVLVDTSVWSLSLRRSLPSDNAEVSELIELIKEVRIQMIGPVRQEILSGGQKPDSVSEIKISRYSQQTGISLCFSNICQ